MFTILSVFLFPFSLVYGLVVVCRNLLFDIGILKQHTFAIPVFSVGNITVGGTGKTPHVEYLARILKNNKIAVLSRGYKRKTKGFLLADHNSTSNEIGDEPLQLKNKFPDVTVAVDEKRVHGIYQLIKTEKPDLVLLDDAYQHRYVKPDINILLVDFNRPIFNDIVFPAGRLREPAFGKKRAQVIIVTKCPDGLSISQKEKFVKSLKPKKKQHLFFSAYTYGDLTPVFPGPTDKNSDAPEILAFAGIAKPGPFFAHLEKTYTVTSLSFPDHHMFTSNDLFNLKAKFDLLGSDKKFMVTTEKDAMRIRNMSLGPDIKKVLFYIPISVDILFGQQGELNEIIVETLKHKSYEKK